ncbi:RNA polymerase recycling motor HelD [Effusibacillus lacus]|uniref:Helicase n=1 Tax=Effusibacillus lacus TaxID=1348429 RepID=A0A292YK03_9BACL|nr:RNA polymerase recycling motor HelD [Effusibacillus lacus]TCS75132.1 DNA helicase-2/ATP-dependent DNA helicase PcrA [Effusibacillus lacus]GAX89083.1 helicase [Effusibacillus lacus]
MGTVEHDWQEEQQRVDRMVDEIDKQIASLQQHVGSMKADIAKIRKNFWEDVTVNFDDAHEAAETYASIKQQAEVLSERERSHRHAENQLKTLFRLKHSPYFGRIDFKENGEKESEKIYLGIASLLDENEEHFLIYDWRAPVASLYYDYPPGPAEYETPGGTITGTLELKRQYMIRDGYIRSMFDTGVTIGDELLKEVLGKHSSTQMRNIVATIQKEQNRIIRNERSRLLIVQGAAGSGKTSAALQRVAYLLYRYRETLQADQIVLISPNPMFNSYVSTVLPELGEENMQQTTFYEYLEQRLAKTFRLETPFTQLEYVLTALHEPGYAARLEGIRFKGSTDFLQVMDLYIENLGREGISFLDVQFKGEVLISAQRIAEQFYSLDASLRIPNRVELLAKWLLAELEEKARLERKKPWVEDEIQLLDQEDFQRVYQELRRRKRFSGDTFNDFALEQKLLSEMIVNRHFKPLRETVKRLRFINMPAIYRQLFTLPNLHFIPHIKDLLPAEWLNICEQTLERLDRSELAYEDATPYLYLKERIEGFRTHTSVRHVFIDEAQDYSPFQFAFLKRLFPHSKMTILGDLNQAIFAHAVNSDFEQLSSIYGDIQTEKIVLTRSYRSTRQIVEFTRGIIEGGDRIEPFNRGGRYPTVTQAADTTELAAKIKERIRSLQSEGHSTIAVIAKTASECQEAYEALQGEMPLRLITKETISFEPGILIIPSYLAKGVEFDAVIIYNASQTQYGRESERKIFYTACTRAMHELHVYSVGEMSRFLRGLSPDTYIKES